MTSELVPIAASSASIPAAIAASGESAGLRFLEFFTSNIRNRHTRPAYCRAVGQFLAWCEAHGVRSLADVQPLHVATWIEAQTREAATPTTNPFTDAVRVY
jgi:integrase/recombinase XerC